MLTAAKLKKFSASRERTKVVTLESMEGEQCIVKKFTMADTLAFRDKTEEEMLFEMLHIGVVDEKGKRIFSSASEVAEMDPDVVTEMVAHLSDFNSVTDVESQAKKS